MESAVSQLLSSVHWYSFICLYNTNHLPGTTKNVHRYLSTFWRTRTEFWMNYGQVCGTNWKPQGIWQCRLHARQNCSVSVLNVLICSLIKHKWKYIHRKLILKSFCVIDFFYLKRLISFVMMEFLVGKWCLYTVCILYSAQFTYWTRSFICEVYYQIVCAVCLSITICLFVDWHFKILLPGIGKMSVCAPELKEEQWKE